MVAKELLDYIENTLKDGFPEEDIKRTLVDAGWRREDVIAAFVTVKGAKVPPVVPPVVPPSARPPEQKPVNYASSGAESPQSLLKERPSGSGAYSPSPAPFFSPKTADVIFEKKPAEPQISSSRVSTELPLRKSLSDLAAAKHKSRTKGMVISIVVAVVLLFGGGTLFAYMQGYWPFAAPAPQEIVNNVPPPPPEIADPIQAFRTAFGAQDYKVTLSGILAFEQKLKSGTSTLEVKFASDRFSAYQKGVPVFVADSKKSIGMIDGHLTLLAHQAKTYSLVDDPKASPAVAATIRGLFDKASPVYNLIAPSSSPVLWEKDGELVWFAKFNATSSPVMPLPSGATSTEIRIVLDRESNLIQTISVRMSEADVWQDAQVTYEILPAVGDLLAIPPEYKQVKLSVVPG